MRRIALGLYLLVGVAAIGGCDKRIREADARPTRSMDALDRPAVDRPTQAYALQD